MTRNDLATYELMSRAGNDIKSGMLQYGLSRAADVKPETTNSTSLTETTQGTDGMVYDEDTGRYLPKYMDGGQPTEQAQAQMNTPADGVSEAPEGMRPMFSAKTTTRHKMGDREQEAPFSPEQVDAQRFRNQADVYTRFGMADKAAAVHGLAKGREEEGRSTAIRKSFTEGMKKHADLKPLEAQWKTISGVANTAFEQGDFATWKAATESAAGIQSKLMSNAMDRADVITDPKARLTMIVDAHGRYALDGKMGHAVTQNQDGTLNVLNEDGSVLVGNIWPGAEDPSNPKSARSINQVVAFLRDPQKVRELQQRAAEAQAKRLADRDDKRFEWENKPIELNEGSRIVIPGKGGAGATGADAGQSPAASKWVKDFTGTVNSIYKDPEMANAAELLKSAERRQQIITNGAKLKATMGGRISDAEIMEIADKGQYIPTNAANAYMEQEKIEVSPGVFKPTGETRRLPSIMHKGQQYPILENGAPPPERLSGDMSGNKAVTGSFDRLRDPSTFKQARAGMRKASNTPTPAGFPRVSAADQSARDADAGKMLMAEYGSVQQAQADLSDLDAALRNPKLDGTQRLILKGHRDRLAAGIAAAG
jgi:hypothetical protein